MKRIFSIIIGTCMLVSWVGISEARSIRVRSGYHRNPGYHLGHYKQPRPRFRHVYRRPVYYRPYYYGPYYYDRYYYDPFYDGYFSGFYYEEPGFSIRIGN